MSTTLPWLDQVEVVDSHGSCRHSWSVVMTGFMEVSI